MESAVYSLHYAMYIKQLELIYKKNQHFVILELQCMQENVHLLLGIVIAQMQVLAHHTRLVLLQEQHLRLDAVYLLIQLG